MYGVALLASVDALIHCWGRSLQMLLGWPAKPALENCERYSAATKSHCVTTPERRRLPSTTGT